MSGAQVKLLALQAKFVTKPGSGNIGYFARDNQSVRPEHNAKPILNSKRHRFYIEIIMGAGGGMSGGGT